MAWITPVTDRTAKDALLGTAKGCCNAQDLNRLEENSARVAMLLGLTIAVRKTPWSRLDLPTAMELGRVLDNIAAIRSAYTPYLTTPQPPEKPLNYWQKWNDAEKILEDSYRSLNENMAEHSRCGELSAGERIGVL